MRTDSCVPGSSRRLTFADCRTTCGCVQITSWPASTILAAAQPNCRQPHVASAATHVQHMHKALERMNIKLHDVISSLAGLSGLAVIRAIVAGERSPEALLALCDQQIRRAKAEQVKESLRGTWNAEHLFALRQALQSWEL